ncbi:hypothetical protein HBH92_120910 [Parastagonospora nodorum]|nr:hypothetical protein HBH52_125310 [Parastagonospora nodorum]KAH4049211.1 hypothetical protein HBH49_143730 [Parastagonospora nodorum]KAH4067803.1 hypothetical protein HBH50_132200 [Parastagonospora nodorum]KAH4086902.1 hypothetical protein HBH48_141620 [Parastagonospora nodorum]KAH4170944.1 hypothetical protein HBH43_105480 [Parastagonospora nodorum]
MSGNEGHAVSYSLIRPHHDASYKSAKIFEDLAKPAWIAPSLHTGTKPGVRSIRRHRLVSASPDSSSNHSVSDSSDSEDDSESSDELSETDEGDEDSDGSDEEQLCCRYGAQELRFDNQGLLRCCSWKHRLKRKDDYGNLIASNRSNHHRVIYCACLTKSGPLDWKDLRRLIQHLTVFIDHSFPLLAAPEVDDFVSIATDIHQAETCTSLMAHSWPVWLSTTISILN